MGSASDVTSAAVRESWSASLNAAVDGRPVLFHRGNQEFALLAGSLLRDVLRHVVPIPEVSASEDSWTVLLPGYPVAADGLSLDDAVRDFISALREYADAWDDRLHRASNHRQAALLVQYVFISDDHELLSWAGIADGRKKFSSFP